MRTFVPKRTKRRTRHSQRLVRRRTDTSMESKTRSLPYTGSTPTNAAEAAPPTVSTDTEASKKRRKDRGSDIQGVTSHHVLKSSFKPPSLKSSFKPGTPGFSGAGTTRSTKAEYPVPVGTFHSAAVHKIHDKIHDNIPSRETRLDDTLALNTANLALHNAATSANVKEDGVSNNLTFDATPPQTIGRAWKGDCHPSDVPQPVPALLSYSLELSNQDPNSTRECIGNLCYLHAMNTVGFHCADRASRPT